MWRVLSGDVEGFDEARTGQALRRASLLSRLRHQPAPRRGPRSKLPFSHLHGAWTALLGLALDDVDAEPLYQALLELPDGSYRDGDELPLFVRELLALRAGRRPRITPRLGPFEDTVRLWQSDPQLLALRLVSVLDWHAQKARGSGAVFDDPACRLYPLEILAVRNVRQWLDLKMPKVDHPMMSTNLVTMIPRKPWPTCELANALQPRRRRA